MALKEESNVALRVAHLGMIQGAITRMSGFSASAKTFTITILAGLAAISLQADAAQLGVMALIATIALAAIDVYYMTLELRFRAFYDEVVARDLDTAADLSIAPLKKPGDIKRAINSTASKLFYLPVLFACVLFIGYGVVHAKRSERLPRPDHPRVEQPVKAKPDANSERLGKPIQSTVTTEGSSGRIVGQPAASSADRPIGSVRSKPGAEPNGRDLRTEGAGRTTH